MARVFISHSSANRDAAVTLAEWLRQAGFPDPFLDVEDLRVGQEWERRLYEEIERCDALLILLSHRWLDSKWCFAEYTQARAFGKPILPLICEPLERQDLDTFVPQIQRLAYWDNRDQALVQLHAALSEISLESGGGNWPPADDPLRSPFPGLQPFQELDAPVFHGREAEIRTLLEHLNARRVQWGQTMLLLHGASGVGKSSLLRAGVIPRLRRLRQQWIVLPTIRPHPDPCKALLDALSFAFSQEKTAPDPTTCLRKLQGAATADDLDNAWRDLATVLLQARGAHDARILITIDQGEELLAGHEPDSIHTFYRWLEVALKSDQPYQVLMAVRSDSLGRLREESDLGERMATYLLPRLALEKIAVLIEGPAKAAGILVDPQLTIQAARDTAEEQALPLLACVLRELHVRHGDQRRFTIDDYQSLGNRAAGETPLARVISEKADEALAHLRPEQSPADAKALEDLRLAFLRLVRLDEDRLIRWPALVSELPPGAHPLLRRLASAHLIAIDDNSQRVEVTHDALLEHWPRLHLWLQQARDLLITRSLLEDELRHWQQAPVDLRNSALLSGLKLEKGRGWLAQLRADQRPVLAPAGRDQELRTFVEASDREARRQERRKLLTRRLLMGFGWGFTALLLVASAGTGWLLQRARIAQSSNFMGLHQAQLDSDPLWSLIHGLAALKRYGLDSGTAVQLAISLQEALRRPLAVTPLIAAQQQGVTSLAIDSEREWISGGANGQVRHWRLGTLLSATHSGANGQVAAVVVLGDGDWISASGDGSLIRWRQGLPVTRLNRPDGTAGEVVSLLALPGGDWVSGSARGELVLWRGDQPLRTLAGAARDGNPSAQGWIWSLGAGRDGRWASGGSNGRVQLWDRNGLPLGGSIQTRQGQIFALLIRKDGSLVSGGSDGTLRFWSSEGRPLRTLRSLDNASVWGLAELANGELLSAGRYGALQRWRSGEPVGKPLQTGHRGQWSLVGSSDRRTVVTYGETEQDDRFQAWRLVPDTENNRYVPSGGLWSATTAGRGKLVSGWRDGGLRQGLAGPLRGDVRGEGIWQLERLHNGDLLSIGTEGGLRRWPAASMAGGSPGQPAWGQLIDHHAGQLLSVREHRAGWLLGDRQGRLWYWPGGQPSGRPLFTGASPLFSLLSLSDGWVSGWGDGKLRIHQRGRLQTVDSGQPMVLSLAGLADGEWLSGGSDGSLQRWRGGQRAGTPFASGQTTVWGLLPMTNGDVLSIGEEGPRSTVRLISPRWVAGLACRELADHPALRQGGGAAAEAANLCRQLKREQERQAGQPGDAPLQRYLQRAVGQGKKGPDTVTLKDGRSLRWLPQPLSRVSASSLLANLVVDGQPRQAELNCRLGYWQTFPGGRTNHPDTADMRLLFERICSRLDGLPAITSSAQRWQALLFDPPTQVRRGPNDARVCLLERPREISVLGIKDLWLDTDACGAGRRGVIHRSMVRF